MGDGPGAPVLLVHGTGSDHTTWRAVAPLLVDGRPVHAMDRRGRGASGDARPYAADREAEDTAAVAEALASRNDAPITVAGHSLGGRLALAAALRTDAIARVLAYESAPAPRTDGESQAHEALLARLRAHLEQGDGDAVLAEFLREAGGLPEAELEAFRASPLWPVRTATAPQIVRELDAVLHDDAIGIDRLAGVRQPVLQLTGSRSPARFGDGAAALHVRLARGRLETIDGALHAAHHSHARAFAGALRRFADGG
jgi:pimeloyl-ACP methyl ester carboxylesterase